MNINVDKFVPGDAVWWHIRATEYNSEFRCLDLVLSTYRGRSGERRVVLLITDMVPGKSTRIRVTDVSLEDLRSLIRDHAAVHEHREAWHLNGED